MLLPIIILTNIKHNVTRCQGQIGNFVPLFCGIELVLQIRDDQLRRAKKQPECIEVEPEQDGKLLQKPKAIVTFCVLFKFCPKGKDLLGRQAV